MDISNENELIKALTPVIKECIDNVADYILGKVVDYIQRDVYDKAKPYVYQRSHEFINSWIKEVEQQGKSQEIVAEISL